MPKYRVTASRLDINPHIIGKFKAGDDKEAQIIFRERFKNNKNYDWDYLVLERIDQEEKMTLIRQRPKGV